MRWSWPRPVRARRALFDAGLWAVLATPVAYARLTPPDDADGHTVLVGLLVLLGAAVALSRRYPLVALVLIVLATLVDGNLVFGIPVVSYLAGLRLPRVWPAAAVFAGIAVAGTLLNLGVLGTAMAVWFLAATTLLFAGVFPWLLGRYRRQQRQLVLAGWEQAEALAREHRAVLARVRLRERARIAQDMHDSLGHDLSLIALRAGALELDPTLDERHRAAAGELRASVCAATDRLRDIVGVLREDAVPAPTRPVGDAVRDVVAGARDAGMAVRLRLGAPVDALPVLTAGALHQVVREALTNAARYAPGAAVAVEVGEADGQLEVSVANPAPPAGPLPGPVVPGTGLLALAERVRLAGGTLHAGPAGDADGTGFTVRARLPLVAARQVHPQVCDRTPVELGTRSTGRLVRSGAQTVDWPGVPGGRTGDGSSPGGYRLRQARRQVRRSLLVAVCAPMALAAALSLVYYPIATVGTVLEPAAFDRMR